MTVVSQQRFIDAIVRRSLHGSLEWRHLDDVPEEILTYDGNFRLVYNNQSYICCHNNATVYLVYSMFWPTGQFDFPEEQLELYLHLHKKTFTSNNLVCINLCDKSELYRLQNTVRYTLSRQQD